MMKVAVLDDWQRIAGASADWRPLKARAEVVFFHEAFAGEDEAAQKLADFDIVMAMRERTAFPPSLVARLPKLKLFGMTGKRGATIDLAGMAARGITLTYTSGSETGAGTAELALGLMMAAARNIARGDAAIRAGGFQDGVPAGPELAGKTLGVIGLGKIGQHMARYGRALGMTVLAWSPNLTEARAAEGGTAYRAKDDLLAQADVVSLHIVLSERTRGLIGARELGLMKPGAILVNTSRGPLVEETALIAALETGRLIAALDVYDREPLPPEHPLRRLTNTVLTPHLGYGTRETFAEFYGQGIENVLAFLDDAPIRLLNPGK